jgi:hypothetical protein
MCLSINRCCQIISTILSPDNPNGLCRSDSYCRISIFITFGVIITLLISYFSTIGLGYGMTYAIMGKEYDMLTGCNLETGCRSKIICYNDQRSAFYVGCIATGLLCIIVLVLGIFGLTLLVCIFNCLSTPCMTEISAALASAEKIVELNEIEAAEKLLKSKTSYGSTDL